jgi:hypothetical protein
MRRRVRDGEHQLAHLSHVEARDERLAADGDES